MGTCAVRLEPSGVGNGVGVNVGVGVGDGVPRGGCALAVADGVGLGAGVGVSNAVGVSVGDGDEVAVGVSVGDGVEVGIGVAVGVGVPNKPAAGSRRHIRASGDDSASGDSFNPSCRTVSRSSRTARNQKRAIARKAAVMAGMIT
jgi:hypothetical protein